MSVKVMGHHGIFFLYTTCIALVGFTCFFVLPETAGMSLTEIQDIYNKKASDTKKYKEVSGK